ncbi:DMT family transporter [Taklimakanibacter lacteus]|uniref:DMT family transporter n=1 Tax=Taklimakanibacter lacteus TaxID=2268456 RepID=UPI000E67481B
MIRRESLFPVLLALLWGFNWPAVKIALGEIPPFALRSIGLASGSLLLLLVALALRRRLAVARASWLPLILAGTLNIAGFNIFTAFAQLITTTSRAAILTYTMPVWSVLLAALILGEAIDRRKALALGSGALGIALLAYPVFESGATPGLIFPLLAALSWSLGTIVLKKWPLKSDPIATTAYQLMIGAAISGIGLLVSGQAVPASLSGLVAGALAFHVIGAMAGAYMLWFAILARNPASTSALLSFAVPVVGVLSAMLLVGDRPSLLDIAGFAAILLAVAYAWRPPSSSIWRSMSAGSEKTR